MPVKDAGPHRQVNWCRKAFAWSTHRGGCRFVPGHAGPCKPGRYKR